MPWEGGLSTGLSGSREIAIDLESPTVGLEAGVLGS